MFLGKYENKKRLGKGAYGDVYLVEDDKGTQYALKLISVKMIQSEPHLRQYLDGEIQCMKAMNSPYIIKLYDVQEDQTNIYLLLEYCEGGDLINYQAKLNNRVFTIEKATQVLSEVIRGLEELHQEGYLHRDIKSQNVLIKVENGKEIYKLADFGFSKKKDSVGGTILGTEQFMSPEIFSGDEENMYGFEVDMWAFGVLFYFMLNMEFPFKVNPHLLPEKKQVQLKKLAQNFSYKAAVKNTRKKIETNCTNEIQDLFKKMFTVDGNDRITFSEIRKHPVFVKHFPVVPEASKILYGSKFKSRIVKKEEVKRFEIKPVIQEEDNIRGTISIMRKKDKKYPQQKQILEKKKDQVDFLKDNALEFLEVGDILKSAEKLMLSYNLLKYYIILLRNFKNSLNKQSLNNKYPGLKWNQYSTTKEFKELVNEVDEDILKNQIKISEIYDDCQNYIKTIQEINPKFSLAFHREVEQNNFDGSFKQSYRKSTIYVFGVLRQILKSKSTRKGNKLNYILSLLVISHAFNNIFSDIQNLGIIFQAYFQQKKKTVEKIDYSELRQWMSKSKEGVLNNIAKTIIKIYFAA